MYYLAGFFGAAAFGQDTEGNILENSLGSNTKAQGALNIFMTGMASTEPQGGYCISIEMTEAFGRDLLKGYNIEFKQLQS